MGQGTEWARGAINLALLLTHVRCSSHHEITSAEGRVWALHECRWLANAKISASVHSKQSYLCWQVLLLYQSRVLSNVARV